MLQRFLASCSPQMLSTIKVYIDYDCAWHLQRGLQIDYDEEIVSTAERVRDWCLANQ